ncbi:Glutathione S-transferase [Rhynchospora pubera]|uniref:Glutathione S-transferase n=1 Tax=Rhynchospora pubera TaxID=906938 RepID=A0AAV8BU51_9POAL|nr:Glutathione S-transferase [Rhynchospora pubera]KAJ4760317.1 Glutathione S-transferase [Rhynchospora pubera]KAJ4812787.1 Glutathione S-transferase [Rhynchospora pubera]
MAEAKDIKLFGAAYSGFATMVHHALRLKGVSYDYIEVDLKNKSEEFLRMNPVHKKVPVLVVDGKPIPESLIILQYVDETWKEPPLMPQDVYLRSKVRFWADFIYQKMIPQTKIIRESEGEAHTKAIEEFHGQFKTLEDGIKEDVHVQGPFIHGENPGILDVIIGTCGAKLKHFKQVPPGVKLVDKELIPLLCSTIDAYAELDIVKETTEMLSQYLHA